ncbi:hypothetical protein LCGC14_1278910, partial [marine sediment metagenome]
RLPFMFDVTPEEDIKYKRHLKFFEDVYDYMGDIVGRKLRETSTKHNVKITTLLTDCAEDMKISDRKLWYAVKFFDKYPRLDKLPDGKNISWNKIKTKYLTERTKKEKEYTICDKCGSKIEKEATSK